MEIKVNNYCKGRFKNQLEQAFTLIKSQKNKNMYTLKNNYEYRGKINGYHCFSKKGTRKEILEIQILCTIVNFT